MGQSPAMPAAKSVIASAKRLMELRHFWRSSSRNAEMNVPAWPMPIHHTKLMIAKPHATGTLTPQMPMPTAKSHAMQPKNTSVSVPAMPNPSAQIQWTGRRSTMSEILSVTLA